MFKADERVFIEIGLQDNLETLVLISNAEVLLWLGFPVDDASVIGRLDF